MKLDIIILNFNEDVVEKYRNSLDVDDQEEESIPDLWRSFGGDR